MKKAIVALTTLALLVSFSQSTVAAPKKKATTKSTKTKSSAASQSSKKKTVGALLKQADRGSGLSMQKGNVALPESRDVFERRGPPVNLSQVKPPRTSSFFDNATDDQVKLEKITEQQINELFKLTQKFKNSPQRGELWLRLAELYVEKAGIIDYRKQGEYDQKLKDYQAGKTKVKPTLNLADAKEYNRKAIQLYEWFVRDFPKDDKMDQALFFLGYNFYELGESKKGTAYYERLTREYPRSPYVTEANFALAEYYFENEKWKTAGDYYAQVLKNKRHRLYTFSLYKTAWTQFRSGSTTSALKTMEKLIRDSREQQAQAEVEGRKNINKSKLESEGLRDIVLFYAEVGEPEKAPGYFKSLAGRDADKYLEKLAYFYGDKGNLPGARVLFNYLVAENPTSPKAFDYKYQIVKLYSTAKKSREFREELFAWTKDFATGSSWYQANQNNKEMTDNSYKLRETTLKNYVLQQHQTAQNSRAPFSQNLALEGYRLYLTEFKDSPTIADMHFYFGELLYDMKKFEEAGAQYRWVVENAPTNAKFYSKAAENTVLALEKDLPKDEEMSAKLGASIEPVSLDSRVERFIKAGQWYLAKVPENEKSAEIKFRIGRLYYQHNQFDQAIPYFRDIVGKHPKTKYAEYSANLLLDIYNIRKDYAGLEKTGAELLALPGIANSKAGTDIREVLEKSSFKKAQDLEVQKKYGESAAQFEAFAKQNAGSSLAVTATFNAAINYERAGNSQKAISSHAAVLNSHDKAADNLKPKSRRIIAKLYQDSGQLEQAAKVYRESANEAGNDPVAPNLFYNAAVLNEAIGNNSLAIQNYELYQQKSKKSSDRTEAAFQIATLLRKQGSITKAADKYKEYVMTGQGTPEKNVEAAYWVFDSSRKLRRTKDTDDWKARVLSLQRKYAPNKKGVGAEYAAKIKFEEAVEVFKELKGIRIPANPAGQQQAAQKKIGLVTKLNAELSDVIKYDSPDEIVGALSILGQANLHMGESLLNAPLPAGLNAEETKQYKEGIAKIAEPFMGKAKESLKAAVDRGSELDVFNDYYVQARQASVRLDPKSFYDGGEMGLDIKQGSWIGL